jgi:phospholipase/carboxylesterase
MSLLKQLEGAFLPPKSGTAKQMVLFLHGYGANGADLLSIGEDWAFALTDTVFLSPNAPEPCEQWSVGYQWFSIRAADGIVTKELERTAAIQTPAAILDAYIDEQLERWHVDESRLFVAGFSQGAMMAMYAMPRRQKACAGIIGYSGMLLDAKGLQSPAIVKPPVLAIHGDADDVVPPFCLRDVEDGFSAAGFDVETILRPGLGHGIDQFGLIRGLQFIKERLEIQAP